MTDEPSIPFNFLVEVGENRMGFSEVSGLNHEFEIANCRERANSESYVRKVPSQANFSTITLKRGIIPAEGNLYKWLISAQRGNAESRDLMVHLLSEKQKLIASWQVQNAFPIKVTSHSLKANNREMAVEAIQLAHEGIVLVVD